MMKILLVVQNASIGQREQRGSVLSGAEDQHKVLSVVATFNVKLTQNVKVMSNVKVLLATLTPEVKDEGKESRPRGRPRLRCLVNIDSHPKGKNISLN